MTNDNWQFQTEQSLVENHGLKLDEFEKIVEGLGREPNLTELGIRDRASLVLCGMNIVLINPQNFGSKNYQHQVNALYKGQEKMLE